MKKRQIEILNYIYNNQKASFEYILQTYDISRRTLYYDIEDINYEIKKYGKLEKIDDFIVYTGSDEIKNEYDFQIKKFNDIDYRRHLIIDSIFNNKVESLDKLAENLMVSNTTIFTDIEHIKSHLSYQKINLIYNNGYKLEGDELIIRDFYLKHILLDEDLLKYSDDRILKINKEAKLMLTDFSISILSKYMAFCETRINNGNLLKELPFNLDEVKEFPYYSIVTEVVNFNSEIENDYFVAYIASLTNTRKKETKDEINQFINSFILNFEKISAININEKENFIRQISNHLLSSYYRIKFDFPIVNPSLNDIKKEYAYLYKIVKLAVNQTKFEVFNGMREDEIGFITMYVGGNIKYFFDKNSKVIIVCPNGIMISKLIESQIINYFPTVEVVDSISSRDIEKYNKYFDYIISTIPLEGFNNLIIVNPIFSKQNIAELSEKLIKFNYLISEDSISKLVEIIKQNAKVYDEYKLVKDIYKFFLRKDKENERRDPLLSELLNKNRVRKLNEVEDWKVAIREAALPLLEDKSIEEKYIESMIESVLEHGPYIVLEDGFAMPHASGGNGVNKLSVSLLALENPVDLLGKPVKVFLVLATTDSVTHLRALSSLSKILEDEENIKVLETGDYDKIINLITTKEE